MRRHVFIDTQMIHPALIRAAVDLLGAGHVMAGSDWPIVDDGPVCGPLHHAMAQAGLSADEQDAIAGGNCLRLLGVAQSRAAPLAARA
jgi:aminocarboxymuconate-semialdehyde decarboxylase